jgi:hypothetical protein
MRIKIRQVDKDEKDKIKIMLDNAFKMYKSKVSMETKFGSRNK